MPRTFWLAAGSSACHSFPIFRVKEGSLSPELRLCSSADDWAVSGIRSGTARFGWLLDPALTDQSLMLLLVVWIWAHLIGGLWRGGVDEPRARSGSREEPHGSSPRAPKEPAAYSSRGRWFTQ